MLVSVLTFFGACLVGVKRLRDAGSEPGHAAWILGLLAVLVLRERRRAVLAAQ